MRHLGIQCNQVRATDADLTNSLGGCYLLELPIWWHPLGPFVFQGPIDMALLGHRPPVILLFAFCDAKLVDTVLWELDSRNRLRLNIVNVKAAGWAWQGKEEAVELIKMEVRESAHLLIFQLLDFSNVATIFRVLRYTTYLEDLLSWQQQKGFLASENEVMDLD